jgi:putative ABC transport system permease protein
MSALLPPALLRRAGWRHLRRQRWQAALALIGIVMGVAVVMGVDVANQAAKASFELSAAQVRGQATHRIVGADGSVDDALYRDLFRAAAAPPMAPVIEARVTTATGERLRLLGLDIFAEGAFRPTLGSTIRGQADLGNWLSRPGAMALSQSAAAHLGLEPGDTLDVTYQGKQARLQVFAISDETTLGSRDLLLVDIATAQALTGLGGALSHIDLALDDAGQAWIEARLPPGVTLIDVDEQTAGVLSLSASFELNLTAMSLLALLVGLFLIFNAMSFSIVQRRQVLGRLRAIGVTRAEIQRLVLTEALGLAVIGTLAGILLGLLLGEFLTRIVAATVSRLYYEVSIQALHVEAWSVLKAVALGLGGTLLASAWPARQAAATPPLTTLSRAALEDETRRALPLLSVAGIGLAAAGLLIALALPGGIVVGFAGLFVLLVGAALLTPPVLHLAHRALARLPLRGIVRMAARDLGRHLSRLGTAGAALMIALSASIGVAVMVESMRGAVSGWLDDLLTADLYVAAAGFEQGASLPPAVASGVPGLAPVDAYSSYRDNTVRLGGRPVRLVATHLAPGSRQGFDFTARGDTDPWRLFDDGAVLVSEPLAYRLDIAPGDRLQLPTPSGPLDVVIGGVFRDYASENGRLFMPRAVYAAHWSDSEIDTLALFSRAGAAALRDAVDDALGAENDLIYTAAGEIYDLSMMVFDRTFRITEVLRLLSLLVAFVGVLSALMAVQLERRKEYAVLRALGLTRRQVTLLVLVGCLLFGLIASLLAVPTGIAMAWILTDAIQLRAFGWTMPFLVDVPPILLTVVLGTLAAVIAGLYPAARSAWLQPAPQLRED